MADTELTAENRLAIRREVEGLLLKIAALFGIVNFAVAAAAIWAMWGTVTSTADAKLEREIRELRDEFDDALKDARELIGRLKTRSEDLVRVEQDIRALELHMAEVMGSTAIPELSDLLTKVEKEPDLIGNIRQVPLLVARRSVADALISGVPGCSEPKLLTGQTEPVTTHWKRYKNTKNGIWTEVDIPGDHFSRPPLIFSSLSGGGSHWAVSGTSSIYHNKAESFRIYLKWTGDLAADLLPVAKESGWHINWMAVGC